MWQVSSPSPMSFWVLSCLYRGVSAPSPSLLSHSAASAKSSEGWWPCPGVPPSLAAAVGSSPGPAVQLPAVALGSGIQLIIHASKWCLNLCTFYLHFNLVWLTSFSVLLCFSSSEYLISKSSSSLWRFWFCSVSLWVSRLHSERASRVLSRRSYGHKHVDVHYTMKHSVSPKHNFALSLTLNISPSFTLCLSFTVLDTVLKVAGKSFSLFTVMTWFIPSMSCFCLLSIFKVQSQTKLSWETLGRINELAWAFYCSVFEVLQENHSSKCK